MTLTIGMTRVRVTREQLVGYLAMRIFNGTACLTCYPQSDIDEAEAWLEDHWDAESKSIIPGSVAARSLAAVAVASHS
jgi:Zn-dependent membrane protease YugP